MDNLASELVVEILDNALDVVNDFEEKIYTLGGDIMDALSCKFQDINLSEIHNSPENIVSKRPLKGVGDQLKPVDSVCEASVKLPPVEKKSRLTDLVKNSKQILSKLILSESNQHIDVNNEHVLRVVNPDLRDNTTKLSQSEKTEKVPSEVLQETADTSCNDVDGEKMEEIDLDHHTSSVTNSAEEIRAKTMTFPLAGPSGPTSRLFARYRTLKFPNDLKHKKWNIGTKIINYIKKKGHKSDENRKKPSNGIEITPKHEDL